MRDGSANLPWKGTLSAAHPPKGPLAAARTTSEELGSASKPLQGRSGLRTAPRSNAGRAGARSLRRYGKRTAEPVGRQCSRAACCVLCGVAALDLDQ